LSSTDLNQAGVNGFLDVARQTYKEVTQDVFDMIAALNGKYLTSIRDSAYKY